MLDNLGSEGRDAPEAISGLSLEMGQIFFSSMVGGIRSSNLHGEKVIGIAIGVTRSDTKALAEAKRPGKDPKAPEGLIKYVGLVRD